MTDPASLTPHDATKTYAEAFRTWLDSRAVPDQNPQLPHPLDPTISPADLPEPCRIIRHHLVTLLTEASKVAPNAADPGNLYVASLRTVCTVLGQAAKPSNPIVFITPSR